MLRRHHRPERQLLCVDAPLAWAAIREMIAALRTPSGEVWGAVRLYRESGAAPFDHDDVEFVRSLAPCFAQGAIRSSGATTSSVR
jgi:hypothetical protein